MFSTDQIYISRSLLQKNWLKLLLTAKKHIVIYRIIIFSLQKTANLWELRSKTEKISLENQKYTNFSIFFWANESIQKVPEQN